jgi:hypothetical protein
MAITRAQQVRQMYKRGTGLGGNRNSQGPAGGASAGGNYGGNRSGGVSANNMSGANTSGRAGDGDGSGFSQFERRQRQNAQLQGAGFLGKDLGMNIGEQDRLAKFGDFVKSGGITGNILSSLFSGNTGTTRPSTTFVGGGGNDSQMQSIPLWAQLGFNNETEYLASLEEENNTDQETTEEDTILKRRFAAEGGSIMPRLSDLSGNVSSAEQMLQEINQRLESAESSLGEGGAMQTSAIGSGFMQPVSMNNPQAPDLRAIPEPMKDPSYRPPQMALPGLTNQTPGRPMQSPLQQGGLMQLQGSSGIPAAGYADGGNVVGGEYDFDSARQMYGLGKLVKKITRSVKKVAKSPIGKAALLYAGAGGLGNLAAGKGFFGGAMSNIFKPTTFLGNVPEIFSGKGIRNILVGRPESIISPGGKDIFRQAATRGIFGTGGDFNPFTAISAASTLSGLLTPEQEEEAQTIADNTGIDIAEIRANPNKYLARRFRAEGGSMDEPVAKKTMPLLDMDGQEMDLRAEGGFVPIGRMEKADDVPARLSKNEFVFTAEAVRNAGEGDVDKGAEVMYNMMKNLESGGEVSEESQGLEGAREMFQTSQRLEEVI